MVNAVKSEKPTALPSKLGSPSEKRGLPASSFSKAVQGTNNELLNKAALSFASSAKVSNDEAEQTTPNGAKGAKGTQEIAVDKKPPKICITIDYIEPETAAILKEITNAGAYVSLFVQCTDPKHGCEKDIDDARKLHDINPDLILLGPHTASPKIDQAAQDAILKNLTAGLGLIEGQEQPKLSGSYHGSSNQWHEGDYAKSPFVKPSYIPKLREVSGGDTLENGASLESFFAKVDAAEGRPITFWTHAAEVKKNPNTKNVLDEILKGFKENTYESAPY